MIRIILYMNLDYSMIIFVDDALVRLRRCVFEE